jgi:hypothetical protein
LRIPYTKSGWISIYSLDNFPLRTYCIRINKGIHRGLAHFPTGKEERSAGKLAIPGRRRDGFEPIPQVLQGS